MIPHCEAISINPGWGSKSVGSFLTSTCLKHWFKVPLMIETVTMVCKWNWIMVQCPIKILDTNSKTCEFCSCLKKSASFSPLSLAHPGRCRNWAIKHWVGYLMWFLGMFLASLWMSLILRVSPFMSGSMSQASLSCRVKPVVIFSQFSTRASI